MEAIKYEEYKLISQYAGCITYCLKQNTDELTALESIFDHLTSEMRVVVFNILKEIIWHDRNASDGVMPAMESDVSYHPMLYAMIGYPELFTRATENVREWLAYERYESLRREITRHRDREFRSISEAAVENFSVLRPEMTNFETNPNLTKGEKEKMRSAVKKDREMVREYEEIGNSLTNTSITTVDRTVSLEITHLPKLKPSAEEKLMASPVAPYIAKMYKLTPLFMSSYNKTFPNIKLAKGEVFTQLQEGAARKYMRELVEDVTGARVYMIGEHPLDMMTNEHTRMTEENPNSTATRDFLNKLTDLRNNFDNTQHIYIKLASKGAISSIETKSMYVLLQRLKEVFLNKLNKEEIDNVRSVLRDACDAKGIVVYKK